MLLHVVLCIGPLARLDRRFLPLLYNRRHLGVLMFTLALAHGAVRARPVPRRAARSIRWSACSSATAATTQARPRPSRSSRSALAALVILFLMAATSHDFWLHNLTAPVWKALHMGVYVAYALLVLHVLFGVAAGRDRAGVGWLVGCRARSRCWRCTRSRRWRKRASMRRRASAMRRARRRTASSTSAASTTSRKRARVILPRRRARRGVRYDGRVSAISNVCQHQNGPLGEGSIVNDCVVCPWHGYEYLPDTGASPPPFTEKVPTFRVRVAGGDVLVDPRPLPPGTWVEPARV